MQTLTALPKVGLGERIAAAWRRWRERRAWAAELAGINQDEIERIARDIGLTGDEFRALAARSPQVTDLLRRRMEVLELDQSVIRAQFPDVMRDLQRCCSLCGSKEQCVRDLEERPASPVWQAYCPNCETLLALIKSQRR